MQSREQKAKLQPPKPKYFDRATRVRRKEQEGKRAKGY